MQCYVFGTGVFLIVCRFYPQSLSHFCLYGFCWSTDVLSKQIFSLCLCMSRKAKKKRNLNWDKYRQLTEMIQKILNIEEVSLITHTKVHNLSHRERCKDTVCKKPSLLCDG